MESLNGLFGLQQAFPLANDANIDCGQLWAARTVNNCKLVKMPESVFELLTLGGARKFNLSESLMALHLRKEADNCLSAAFQFWAIPKVKKLLDEKVNVLVLGGKWSFKTGIEDSYNDGLLKLLLSGVKLQKHLLQCEHFNESFSKKGFIDKWVEILRMLNINEEILFYSKNLRKY